MNASRPLGWPYETKERAAIFDASVMPVDCGEKCAPLNGGIPVCCDTANAVPVMQVSEWKHLRTRSNMWRSFKAYDAATLKITKELDSSCKAAECRGAANCERDNRSLACRTFPFFPYFTKEGEILGLSYYWNFEDRCWVISNMALVQADFIDEFLRAYEILFADDPAEREVYVEHSSNMRRVFSRWKRPIPVIGRNREYYLVKPKGAGIQAVSANKMPTFEPFTSEAAYKKAVKEISG